MLKPRIRCPLVCPQCGAHLQWKISIKEALLQRLHLMIMCLTCSRHTDYCYFDFTIYDAGQEEAAKNALLEVYYQYVTSKN